MKIDKLTILLTTGTTISVLIAIYIDFFLSFKAYQINPEKFITYEANREIVGFFANQTFPYIFFFTTISFPIAAFLFAYYLQKYKKSKFKKEYVACFLLFVYCLIITRISAGLTWFSETRDIMFFFQGATYAFIGALGCLIYVIYKEEKEIEEKRSVKNSSC